MKQVLQQCDTYILNLIIEPIGDFHMIRFETRLLDSLKTQNWPFSNMEMYLSKQDLLNLNTYISNYIKHGE
jgi:hypothetical protein